MNNIVGDTTNDPIRDQGAPRAARMCVELPAGGWTDTRPLRRRRRVAQLAERLSDEEEAAGSSPAPPIIIIHVTVGQPARLKRGASQVRPLPVTSSRSRSSICGRAPGS
jgi:hypothetical protein